MQILTKVLCLRHQSNDRVKTNHLAKYTTRYKDTIVSQPIHLVIVSHFEKRVSIRISFQQNPRTIYVERCVSKPIVCSQPVGELFSKVWSVWLLANLNKIVGFHTYFVNFKPSPAA